MVGLDSSAPSFWTFTFFVSCMCSVRAGVHMFKYGYRGRRWTLGVGPQVPSAFWVLFLHIFISFGGSHMHGSQRTARGDWFSLTTWVLGVELTSLGLVTSPFNNPRSLLTAAPFPFYSSSTFLLESQPSVGHSSN